VKTFIFVNGILNCPGSSNGWTDRAVTWIHTHTEHRAEKFEYFSPVIFRRWFLKDWTNDLAELVAKYAGKPLVLVGHSNGCELICRTVKISGAQIRGLHLISGACAADFYTNGLNAALKANRVGKVVAYVAEKDLPMKIARVSQNLIGWLGLGYGTLGLNGPLRTAIEVENRVMPVRQPDFGHSTWFLDENFDDLMKTITAFEE
jgi:predicted alpha/beta hydrolase family esterase